MNLREFVDAMKENRVVCYRAANGRYRTRRPQFRTRGGMCKRWVCADCPITAVARSVLKGSAKQRLSNLDAYNVGIHRLNLSTFDAYYIIDAADGREGATAQQFREFFLAEGVFSDAPAP